MREYMMRAGTLIEACGQPPGERCMRYNAIIFDLFGTLVDNAPGRYWAALQAEGVLEELDGCVVEEFERVWSSDDAFTMRMLGIHRTPYDSVRHVCEQMGLDADDAILLRAAEIRMDYCRSLLLPRQGVMETLRQIKSAGVGLGLMSVASCEIPELWQDTEMAELFDQAVFSSIVGMTKSEPRFYEITCERLHVKPNRCLYVGDGAGRELTGAKNAGMDAVLMCDPHEEGLVMQREEARKWDGPRISELGQVLELVIERQEAALSSEAVAMFSGGGNV